MTNIQNSLSFWLNRSEHTNKKVLPLLSKKRGNKQKIKQILSNVNSQNEAECELQLTSLLMEKEDCSIELQQFRAEKQHAEKQIRMII